MAPASASSDSPSSSPSSSAAKIHRRTSSGPDLPDMSRQPDQATEPITPVLPSNRAQWTSDHAKNFKNLQNVLLKIRKEMKGRSTDSSRVPSTPFMSMVPFLDELDQSLDCGIFYFAGDDAPKAKQAAQNVMLHVADLCIDLVDAAPFRERRSYLILLLDILRRDDFLPENIMTSQSPSPYSSSSTTNTTAAATTTTTISTSNAVAEDGSHPKRSFLSRIGFGSSSSHRESAVGTDSERKIGELYRDVLFKALIYVLQKLQDPNARRWEFLSFFAGRILALSLFRVPGVKEMLTRLESQFSADPKVYQFLLDHNFRRDDVSLQQETAFLGRIYRFRLYLERLGFCCVDSAFGSSSDSGAAVAEASSNGQHRRSSHHPHQHLSEEQMQQQHLLVRLLSGTHAVANAAAAAPPPSSPATTAAPASARPNAMPPVALPPGLAWIPVMAKSPRFVQEFLEELSRQAVVLCGDDPNAVLWSILPVYPRLVVEFLSNHKLGGCYCTPPLQIPEDWFKASCNLMRDGTLMWPMMLMLLQQTNIYDRESLLKSVQMLDTWFQAMSEFRSTVPSGFDLKSFLLILDKLFDLHHFEITTRTLILIFHGLDAFEGNLRSRYFSEYILSKRVFLRFFLHWHKDVRQCYQRICVYKMVRIAKALDRQHGGVPATSSSLSCSLQPASSNAAAAGSVSTPSLAAAAAASDREAKRQQRMSLTAAFKIKLPGRKRSASSTASESHAGTEAMVSSRNKLSLEEESAPVDAGGFDDVESVQSPTTISPTAEVVPGGGGLRKASSHADLESAQCSSRDSSLEQASARNSSQGDGKRSYDDLAMLGADGHAAAAASAARAQTRAVQSVFPLPPRQLSAEEMTDLLTANRRYSIDSTIAVRSGYSLSGADPALSESRKSFESLAFFRDVVSRQRPGGGRYLFADDGSAGGSRQTASGMLLALQRQTRARCGFMLALQNRTADLGLKAVYDGYIAAVKAVVNGEAAGGAAGSWSLSIPDDLKSYCFWAMADLQEIHAEYDQWLAAVLKSEDELVVFPRLHLPRFQLDAREISAAGERSS